MPIFRRRRARAIQRYVPKGRILDVGCGRGLLPGILREEGWDAYGVERSKTAAENARQELGLEVFVGDFMTSHYAPAFFDVVVFWHVLEHLSDPVAAIRKAREILRPGGLLVVAVPNFESLQARLTKRHWFHLDVPRHYYHFPLKVLMRLLEASGFSIQDVSHFSMEQNPYGWIQSLLDAMGFRKNLLYDVLKNPDARSIGGPLRAHRGELLLLFLLLPIVVPLSLLLSLLETVLRRGGTIELYAHREK